MKAKELFRVSYEKQVIYFVILLIIFFGFTEVVSFSFIKKAEYKWILSKKAELSIFSDAITKILSLSPEEVKRRLLKFVENPNLRRVVVLDRNGQVVYDTSPFGEKPIVPHNMKNTFLTIEHKDGFFVASYWTVIQSQTEENEYLILFSPKEELPFLIRLMHINSYIKFAGTIIGLILGIYFILFVMSPFRRMGEVAREIQGKSVSSVEDIVSIFSRTIKELKRLYSKEKQKVSKMRREILLKENLASLGVMSAGVAHEFKNALGTIIGFTKLAIKKDSNNKYLKKIEREAESLNNVVNEFLFFARPQKLDKENFSIKELLYELKETVPQNITFEIDIDNVDNIYADRGLLKRAFSNILRNAYDAMTDGGKVRVIASTISKKDDGAITVTFIDEGRGIPRSIRRKIFTPFYSTKADGVGLGLSIVYKIIALHNGTVKIKSSKKGTNVEVVLPVKEDADIDEGDQDTEE